MRKKLLKAVSVGNARELEKNKKSQALHQKLALLTREFGEVFPFHDKQINVAILFTFFCQTLHQNSQKCRKKQILLSFFTSFMTQKL